MAEYGKFCPVSLASEVLADRWTPLIVRELVIGSRRFNDIARGLPGVSRSLLVQRLRHLERKGVIARWPTPTGRGSEYHLTDAGRALEPVIFSLGRWAVDWLFDDLAPEEIDVVTLTWWMRRMLDASDLPEQRIVIQFDHTAPARVSIWIVLDHGDASVCKHHPGFEADVVITCETPALAEVFNGLDTWATAVASGVVRIDGPSSLVAKVPRWFHPSPFAAAIAHRAQAAKDVRG